MVNQVLFAGKTSFMKHGMFSRLYVVAWNCRSTASVWRELMETGFPCYFPETKDPLGKQRLTRCAFQNATKIHEAVDVF